MSILNCRSNIGCRAGAGPFASIPLEVLTYILEWICSPSMHEALSLRSVNRSWMDAIGGLTDAGLSSEISVAGVWTPAAMPTNNSPRVRNRLIFWRIPQFSPELLSMIHGVDWGVGWTDANEEDLQELVIAFNLRLSLEHVELLENQPPGIETLNLAKCCEITSFGISLLPKYCPTLTSVCLSDCAHITDDALEALAKLPRLRELNVAWCSNLSDNGVTFLVQGPPLETVDFSWCTRLTEVSLTALLSIPSLESVAIVGCAGITSTAVQSVSENRGIIIVS
jgi:hypothetical protein